MQGSGMFITCLCIYREVRYGHNPYLFLPNKKVMFATLLCIYSRDHMYSQGITDRWTSKG